MQQDSEKVASPFFSKRAATVFCIIFTMCLITTYYANIPKYSMIYEEQPDGLDNMVDTLKIEPLHIESVKSHESKRDAVLDMRLQFQEYWMSISSLLPQNSTEEVEKDKTSLKNEFSNLDNQYESVRKFFDKKIISNGEIEQEGTISEFKILSNLRVGLKNYWLRITSVINTHHLSNNIQKVANDGYIKLKIGIQNIMKDSQAIAREYMRKLQNHVQQNISKLQNPINCNNASVHYCNMINGAGFGSETHSVMKCFLPAFKQQRTLIYRTKGWKYDPAGWSHLFEHLSKCDDTEYSAQNKPQVYMGHGIYPKDYDFQSVPQELFKNITNNHANPLAWWTGQFIGYAMRIRPDFEEQLNETAKSINFTNPIAGMHVRRGDKLLSEAKKHEVEEYMFHIEIWFEEQNIPIEKRTVYVTTDENGVYQELKQKYPSYTFISTPTDTQQRGVSALQGIITDVYLLSQCDFVACTASSNVCRLVYELLSFSHHDAFSRWHSVDTAGYSFW